MIRFLPFILIVWGVVQWHAQRNLQGVQQSQADMLAQSLESFRQHVGRLPCPATDEDGREDCSKESTVLEGYIPWRSLDLHRDYTTLRLRVARVYTQPRILDRLPVDALCRSGLYPDIPLAEEMAAQIVPVAARTRLGDTIAKEKALVTLRRWQLQPHPEAGTPAHLYAEAERREDTLNLNWGTLCGHDWFVQRPAQFTLPRPWPNRHPIEWSASRQGQRGALWEPGVTHPLFVERTGTQWKSIDLLPKEALETLIPRSMAWSGDARWLAILTEESEARLWDCRSLPCVRADLALPEEWKTAAATRSLAFGNGETLILTSAQTPYLLIGQRRGERWDWLPTEKWGLDATPRTARLGADGHRAVWEKGGQLHIAAWLANADEPSFSIAALPEGTNAWTLSPDGRWLAAALEGEVAFFAREGMHWYEIQRQPLRIREKGFVMQWEDKDTLLVLGLNTQIRIDTPRL